MKTELLQQFLDKASTSKSAIKHLKNAAVHAQQYEFAAAIREIEREQFPESDEQKEAKKKVSDYNLIFRMIEINASDEAIYKIVTAIETNKKKKGNLDIRDAFKIIADAKDFFGE